MGRLRLSAWLAPLLLWAQLILCAVLVPPFELGAGALLYLALLYGLLTVVVHTGARFAWRAGRVWGVLACLGVAFLPVAQLRLDAEVLTANVSFVAALLLVAGLYAFGFERALRERDDAGPEPRELLAPYGAFLGLVLLASWGFASQPGLRWLLLRHQRLFGHALYYASGGSIVAERNALWSRQPRLVEPWEFADRTVADEPRGSEGAPHVIFLLVDTLRADALAAHGGDPDWMPNTNALVERSVLLGNVRANASWTRASCASIFTGLLPEEHGAARFHEMLAEEWTTLPELLRAAGYQTAGFVTNWVQVGVSTGFAQGFDTFHELMSAEEVLATGQDEIRDQYARAATLHAEVERWLQGEERRVAAEDGRPVFLYLHYLDPHAPYLAGHEPGTEDDPRERKRGFYRQELRYLDGELGPFFARLDELLPGPKAIVLTSDHGEEFWEHGEWGHGHALYRELLWVPTFVHLTDGAGGVGPVGRSDAPLELRDLFDLVVQLASPNACDPLAWAERSSRRWRYASQYLDRVADARPDKKWTGMRLFEEDGRELIWSAYGPSLELYDLDRDPNERRNRIGDERDSAAALLRGLEDAVRFWTHSPRVERSAGDLEFLRQLGYAGGVDG